MASTNPTELSESDKLNMIEVKQQHYIDAVSKSEFTSSSNSMSCQNRQTEEECTPPHFKPEESVHKLNLLIKDIDGTIGMLPSEKILGFTIDDVGINYKKYYENLLDEYEMTKTAEIQTKIDEGEEQARRLWGEKIEFFKTYTEDLLSNINDNLDVINSGKSAAEQVLQQPDSALIFENNKKMTDLYGLVREYSNIWGTPIIDNMCEWDEELGCVDFFTDEEYEYMGECPECEENSDCPPQQLDSQLADLGGFKLTVGIAIICAMAAKMYMDYNKIKLLEIKSGAHTGVGVGTGMAVGMALGAGM